MGYLGFKLSDVTVYVGNSPAQGTATVTQDERGRLAIHVQRPFSLDEFPAFWQEQRVTIRSSSEQMPSLSIEHAVCTAVTSDEEFWAAQVVVQHNVLPPSTLVEMKYYLTGVCLMDGTSEIDAAGIRWTLALLDGFSTTDRKIGVEGHGLVTATLTSQPVAVSRSKDIDEAATFIALLLSFGMGGWIRIVRADQVRGGGVVMSRLHSGPAEARAFNYAPVLHMLLGPGIVKPFIESCYTPGITISQTLPLGRLIATLGDIRGEPVVHTQGLLAVNFLEIIRYHFALSLVTAGKATRQGEHFYAPGRKTERSWTARVKNLLRPGRRGPMGFAEILKKFCRSIQLTGWDSRYVKFRNRVVHGDEIGGASLLDKHAQVLDVLHFCDRIVLAMLNWDRVEGKYIPCVNPVRTTPKSYGINVTPFVR